MRRLVGGMTLAGLFAFGCGTAQVTGSAKNDWTTPTGHAQATDPRIVDPMDPGHLRGDRSVFAKREAPPLQEHNGGTAIEQPAPPPPAPVDNAAPDITPEPMPEAPPPYVLPPP